MEKNLEKSSCR